MLMAERSTSGFTAVYYLTVPIKSVVIKHAGNSLTGQQEGQSGV